MAHLIIAMLLLLSALGLTFDLPLFSYAQVRADDMVAQDYFRHDLGAYPGSYCAKGELMAKSTATVDAEAVMNAWQDSESHAYVLNELRMDRVGIGIARAEDGTTIWVVALARSC